jgi:hypothetical protein
MRGRIGRRLLISALVDPDEAAVRLPAPLRPHVAGGLGTVVGCCLLELEAVRPAVVPAVLGWSLRAAAHRTSVEWDSPMGPVVGVYVEVRHTDSRLAAIVGGRLVPGVHHRVPFETTFDGHELTHRVGPSGSPRHMDVAVRLGTSVDDDPLGALMSSTCVDATVGLSPGRSGGLDAIGMRLAHHRIEPVELERLGSPFVASFSTASRPVARLMQDVDVVWEPAWSPVPAAAPVLRAHV